LRNNWNADHPGNENCPGLSMPITWRHRVRHGTQAWNKGANRANGRGISLAAILSLRGAAASELTRATVQSRETQPPTRMLSREAAASAFYIMVPSSLSSSTMKRPDATNSRSLRCSVKINTQTRATHWNSGLWDFRGNSARLLWRLEWLWICWDDHDWDHDDSFIKIKHVFLFIQNGVKAFDIIMHLARDVKS